MGSKVNLKKLIVLTVFKKMIMIMIMTMMMMMMRRMRRIVTVMVMIMMMFTMIVRMMVTICRLLILGRPQFKYGGGYLSDCVDCFFFSMTTVMMIMMMFSIWLRRISWTSYMFSIWIQRRISLLTHLDTDGRGSPLWYCTRNIWKMFILILILHSSEKCLYWYWYCTRNI